MNFIPTPLEGVLIIEPKVYPDNRGFFLETYQARRFAENGITLPFVQHNHSKSVKGTLRGLHAQINRPQGKLVRVLEGEIFDVVVDIRRGSPTFKKHFTVTLSAENFRMCYVPPGYAHGFYTVSEMAQMEYKCTDFYDPGGELRLLWKDPELAIPWPDQHPVLSEKDAAGKTLAELMPVLPRYTPAGPSSK